MSHKPSTADMTKRTYCRVDFSRRARFIVLQARGGDGAPADLGPGDTIRARQLAG